MPQSKFANRFTPSQPSQPSQPSSRFASRFKPVEKEEDTDLVSRLIASGKLTAEGVGGMLELGSRLASPTRILGDLITNGGQTRRLGEDVLGAAKGMASPITRGYSGLREDGVLGGLKGVGTGALELIGADPNAVSADFRNANIPGLIGDLAIPTASALFARRLSKAKNAKVLPDLDPVIPEVPPLNTPQRLLGGMTPEGYLHNSGELQPIAQPEFINADIVPGSVVERAAGQRSLPPRRQVPALPAIGETGNSGPAIANVHPLGKAGRIADLDTPEALRSLDLERPGTSNLDEAGRLTELVNESEFLPGVNEPVAKVKGKKGRPKKTVEQAAAEALGVELPPVWDPALGKYVQVGKGRKRRPGELPDLEYPDPVGTQVREVITEGEPPPRVRPTPYDPNKVDVINRRLSPDKPVIPETPIPKGPVAHDRLWDSEKSSRAAINKTNTSSLRERLKATKGKKYEQVSKQVAQELAPVAEPATVMGMIKSNIRNSAFGRIYQKIEAPSTRLEKMGEGGKNLATELRDANTIARATGGKYDNEFSQAFSGLDKAEVTQTIKALDGQIKASELTSPKVTAAYQRIRKALDELASMAEEAGVSGQFGKFKKLAGEYFPHEFEPGKFPKEELRKALLAEGKSVTEVNGILSNSRKFKEHVSSFQKGRFRNTPGYIESPEVLTRYAYEMAKKIEYTKRFGAKDIGDKTSRAHQLLVDAGGDELAQSILNRYFDRGAIPDADLSNAARKLTKWEVATRLSLSAFNQIADVAALPVKTSFKDFYKAVGETLYDSKGAKSKAMSGGNLAILRNESLHELGSGTKFGKIYGLNAIESKLRTIQAVAGRSYAIKLFDDLKRNPDNPTLKARMKSLVEGGDLEKLLKQEKLTADQIDFASGRVSELTAGVPDKISLPPGFEDPLTRLPLLFTRFAYLTTKNLKDIIKTEPTKKGKISKVAQALAAYTVAGEVSGDLKEIAKGFVTSVIGGKGVGERVMDRGKDQWYDTGYEPVNRIIANNLQSWFFGFLGGKIEAVGRDSRGQGLLKDIAGPIGSELGDIGSLAYDTTSLVKNRDEESAKKLGMNALGQVVKRTPYIGSAIHEVMKEKKAKPNSPFR